MTNEDLDYNVISISMRIHLLYIDAMIFKCFLHCWDWFQYNWLYFLYSHKIQVNLRAVITGMEIPTLLYQTL